MPNTLIPVKEFCKEMTDKINAIPDRRVRFAIVRCIFNSLSNSKIPQEEKGND